MTIRKIEFRWTIGILFLLILWFTIHYLKIVSPLFIPSPIEVFVKGFELVFKGVLAKDFLMTVERTFFSFILAVCIGVPIGIILGNSNKLYETCSVLVDFFRSIPGTALFPLFILFFGVGNAAKIGNAVFASSLIILVNSMYGVKNSNKLRIEAAKVMRANRKTIFLKVILPEALPEIIGGLRIAVSICLIVIVVTEMFIGTEYGLGKRIMHSHELFRISEMYASILLTGFLGYALNQILLFVEKRYVHWAGR